MPRLKHSHLKAPSLPTHPELTAFAARASFRGTLGRTHQQSRRPAGSEFKAADHATIRICVSNKQFSASVILAGASFYGNGGDVKSGHHWVVFGPEIGKTDSAAPKGCTRGGSTVPKITNRACDDCGLSMFHIKERARVGTYSVASYC